MDAQTEALFYELRNGRRPAPDHLADTLLVLAVRNSALSRDEASRLIDWDLPTIAEYLALRLQSCGVLSAEEVDEIVEPGSETVH